MNEVTPPPEGWFVLVIAFALFVLADKMFGRQFWEVVKIGGLVVVAVLLLMGLMGGL
jgi:hypothetical protein